MKRRILLTLVCLIGLLLSGCTSVYNPYPKNTVMIKTMEATEQLVAQDDAMLSEETLRTLAINGINKYFDHQLSEDNVQFQIFNLDYGDLKQLLMDATSYLDLSQNILDSYIEFLNKAPGGYYAMQLTNLFNQYDAYGLIINPVNGEILNAATFKRASTDVKRSVKDIPVDNEKLIQLAKQFVEEKELVAAPIDPDQISIYQSWNELSELYYTSADRQVLLYWQINHVENRVVDFSRGIMAAVQIAQFESRISSANK